MGAHCLLPRINRSIHSRCRDLFKGVLQILDWPGVHLIYLYKTRNNPWLGASTFQYQVLLRGSKTLFGQAGPNQAVQEKIRIYMSGDFTRGLWIFVIQLMKSPCESLPAQYVRRISYFLWELVFLLFSKLMEASRWTTESERRTLSFGSKSLPNIRPPSRKRPIVAAVEKGQKASSLSSKRSSYK